LAGYASSSLLAQVKTGHEEDFYKVFYDCFQQLGLEQSNSQAWL
jgi:hypothetical protein